MRITLFVLGLLAVLLVGFVFAPGCASTGHGGVAIKFADTNGNIGLCIGVKTQTATNVYKLTAPISILQDASAF
jgi:hypothetical protein